MEKAVSFNWVTDVLSALTALDTNFMMVLVVLCAFAFGAMALYAVILALKR